MMVVTNTEAKDSINSPITSSQPKTINPSKIPKMNLKKIMDLKLGPLKTDTLDIYR